jgi:hypothetical protein
VRASWWTVGHANSSLTLGWRRYVSDVHVLDVATWSWSQPAAHGARPSPRDKFTAVVWDRKLYTFGGFGPGLSGDDESVDDEDEEEEEQGEGTSFTWYVDDCCALW